MTVVTRTIAIAGAWLLAAAASSVLHAQTPKLPAPPPVEKLGPSLLRIGSMRIDTARREITVPASINEVMVIEWVATTKNAVKAYESALTVDADAIAFNTALLLIGVDKDHASVPTEHFDPKPPQGDPLEIMVEWTRGAERVRVPVEQLLYDKETKKTMVSEGWVYTGSSFIFDWRFWADADGTLIGFVHSPAPLIEQVGRGAVGRYGAIVINPNLGLTLETPLTLTVRNITPKAQPR